MKRTIAKNVKKLITWYINENGAQFDLYFGLMDLMDLLLLKTVIDYHYFWRFEQKNMSIYEILSALDLTQIVHAKICTGMQRG